MSENLVMRVDVRKPKEKYCIESEELWVSLALVWKRSRRQVPLLVFRSGWHD